MPTNGSTPNFALVLPYGNRQNWTDLVNSNFRVIDALIATYVSVSNLQGLWTNNTAYVIGDNVVDETSGVVYTAQVNHTSSSAPTTFLQERANNPTYWLTFSVAARNRGAWQTATAYALNDFVLADGTKYAMCISANTSGATFTADLALGYWTVMIDLSTAGSLVLPVLSGGADANKFVITNGAGTSYTINSAATAASLLNGAGLATLANPTFTGNPIAPTQTAEDNDTSIATTEYADNAVRSMVIRRQTFSAGGTYTPHAKMIYCDIEAVGGGGGGGGQVNSGAGVGTQGGGGGGAGGYSKIVVSKATIGASQTVTLGIAGTAGTTGGTNGGNGGDTSVGTICIAKGGSGGTGNGGGLGGLGGVIAGAVGDIKSPGMPGGTGPNSNTTAAISAPGNGGSGIFGAGGRQSTGGTGETAVGFGAGGAGGSSQNAAGAAAGGAGTAGYVVITEYCYG